MRMKELKLKQENKSKWVNPKWFSLLWDWLSCLFFLNQLQFDTCSTRSELRLSNALLCWLMKILKFLWPLLMVSVGYLTFETFDLSLKCTVLSCKVWMRESIEGQCSWSVLKRNDSLENGDAVLICTPTLMHNKTDWIRRWPVLLRRISHRWVHARTVPWWKCLRLWWFLVTLMFLLWSSLACELQ